MPPLMQEAHFACFDEDEKDRAPLPRFFIANPVSSSHARKSFSRARTFECTGSGHCYFHHERLRDRFVTWRVVQNVVLLREWSFHRTLQHNGLQLELPAPVVATGIAVVERWEDDDAVEINIVTHAGTIHRFTYAAPSGPDTSIFVHSSGPPNTPASRARVDVFHSLNAEELVTAALWLNEYNLVVGTDAGRVLGINFGLPQESSKLQEFIFSDTSVVSWLWHGLLQSTAAKWTGSRDETRRKRAAVIGMTWFEIAGDEEAEEEGEDRDICVMTLSADGILRAWSFGFQSCLGHQQLVHVVTGSLEVDDADDDDETMADRAMDGMDATHAKLVALSRTKSDNCRILIHFDTSSASSSEILLLRGNVRLTAVSRSGAGEELALEVARVFTIEPPPQRRVQLVDFVVDKTRLVSSWRSLDGDDVVIHPNPMACTGPKRIVGHVVYSLARQMRQYEKEDSAWVFDLKDKGITTDIDDFFLRRILLPGRFSKRSLSTAMLETRTEGTLDSVSNYRHTLCRLISAQCARVPTQTVSAQNIARIRMWQDFIALCTTQWHLENVPIGFAPSTNALLPGAPVILRRNGLSFLFPSASVIATGFASRTEPKDPSLTEGLSELCTDMLPIFDAFPSQSFQSYLEKELADVASEWKVESMVACARHCVRLGLTPNSDTRFTRIIIRLSTLLRGDAALQEQMLGALMDHVEGQRTASKSTARPDEDARPSTCQAFFASREMSVAFAHVTARTIEEMCSQARRLVLLFAYLVDTRPAFLASQTLHVITKVMLPKAIRIYQHWRLGQWIASDGTLHDFILESNDTLTRSNAVQRAVRALAPVDAADAAHDLFATFTREILDTVVHPTAPLVEFFTHRRQFSLVRAVYCVQVRQVSGEGLYPTSELEQSVRAIGKALAYEGQAAARRVTDDAKAQEHAHWCFVQATRCFRIGLSTYLEDDVVPRAPHALDEFVYDVVDVLKATIGRGFYRHLLRFLWTVGTQVKHQLTHKDGDHGLRALHTFSWLNVFKYSVQEHLFRDAHLALMQTTALAAAASGTDAHEMATECVHYLVTELVRAGELALVGELPWGALEHRVEEHLLWQAASTVPNARRYYPLLFTFYMRKQQPAHAASSMYALARRLELVGTGSKNALETQRSALLAACNALRLLPIENRWIVRKEHEQAPASSTGASKIITLEEMQQELDVLGAKHYLVEHGHCDSMLLSTMAGDEVMALLVDAVYKSSFAPHMTHHERRRLGILALEIALTLGRKRTSETLTHVTRSLTRYAVEAAVSTSRTLATCTLLWDFLELFLTHAATLTLYEVAAATILSSWQASGHHRALPTWLKDRLADPEHGNPALLLRLYVKHGLLLEGHKVASTLVAAASTAERVPWIPYEAVDLLLDATTTVLATKSATISSTALASLRTHDETVRQHLAHYFGSITARQQAQETLSLAGTSIDTS
ncbi:hypothetical protein PsorP6_011223 [Peronosclerospora sorghi]|uniref:Uncharacterized protein n=1 Tax=Peronosclerospora sorghi TaxID=230839 RepID=A0ACC0VTT2_9STRA|nr:hypothetical protein PsorP6_011223 [Peronosclerospora sorghi]